MKKLLAILLVLVLMFSLAACKGGWEGALEDYEDLADDYIEAMKDGDEEEIIEIREEAEELGKELEKYEDELEGEELEEFLDAWAETEERIEEKIDRAEERYQEVY